MKIIKQPHQLILLLFAGIFLAACEQGPMPAAEMSQQELTARIADSTAPLILDVRTTGEYSEGHLPGAVNIPHAEVADRIAGLNLDATDEIVVHCYSGKRAGIAKTALEELGYTNVRHLEGDWQGWNAAGLPTE